MSIITQTTTLHQLFFESMRYLEVIFKSMVDPDNTFSRKSPGMNGFIILIWDDSTQCWVLLLCEMLRNGHITFPGYYHLHPLVRDAFIPANAHVMLELPVTCSMYAPLGLTFPRPGHLRQVWTEYLTLILLTIQMKSCRQKHVWKNIWRKNVI